MKICPYKSVELKEVADKDAKDVAVRWVIADKDGAENFYMRVFDVQPGGHTPFHKHPWEHEVFILDGKAVVTTDEGEEDAPAGSVVFILSGEQHQFRNESSELMRFICLIPKVE